MLGLGRWGYSHHIYPKGKLCEGYSICRYVISSNQSYVGKWLLETQKGLGFTNVLEDILIVYQHSMLISNGPNSSLEKRTTE